MTTRRRRLHVACAAIAIAITALAMAGYSLVDESDASRAAPAVPPASGWGDARIPYRAGSGRFCEVAAEGTSIRPDVANRLVFLDALDAQHLITELRARDRELVTVSPIELAGDLNAIAQAADRLYDGVEANGFDVHGVPEGVLMSLSERNLRPAFERATSYLREQCDIDIWAVLSTV
jgi:hypothetical protein